CPSGRELTRCRDALDLSGTPRQRGRTRKGKRMIGSGWSQFSFADPMWLWLLLLLPVLAVLKGRFGGTAGVTFSSTASLVALGQRRRSRAGAVLALLAHLALAALILALA